MSSKLFYQFYISIEQQSSSDNNFDQTLVGLQFSQKQIGILITNLLYNIVIEQIMKSYYSRKVV